MPESYYAVVFDYDGIHYEGRITPEIKKKQLTPSSYHVVLNDVFFGYIHKDNGHWLVSEQRPDGLAQEVGKQIEEKPHDIHMVE